VIVITVRENVLGDEVTFFEAKGVHFLTPGIAGFLPAFRAKKYTPTRRAADCGERLQTEKPFLAIRILINRNLARFIGFL
jgi:hypothetical protein